MTGSCVCGLRQAFGRLIRRASDRGVFVLLDRQAPSRLMSAFPAGVVVRRVGLAQAVSETGRVPADARLNFPPFLLLEGFPL